MKFLQGFCQPVNPVSHEVCYKTGGLRNMSLKQALSDIFSSASLVIGLANDLPLSTTYRYALFDLSSSDIILSSSERPSLNLLPKPKEHLIWNLILTCCIHIPELIETKTVSLEVIVMGIFPYLSPNTYLKISKVKIDERNVISNKLSSVD